MNYLLIVALFCFSMSCQHRPQHAVVFDRKLSSFAKEVKKTDDLQLIGFGGSAFNEIKSFFLAFTSNRKYTIDQARCHFFQIANRFLLSVNNDPIIYPYLSTYPFTMDQLDLIILYNPVICDGSYTYVTGVIWEGANDHAINPFILYSMVDARSGKKELFTETLDKAQHTHDLQQSN